MVDPTKEIEILQLPLRLALICGNVLVTIFAICGNTIAIIVASKSRLTSTPTRLCLLSLALSDLFLTASSAPLDLGQIIHCLHGWIFDQFLCKTQPFIQFLFLMANSLSLLAMVTQRLWSSAILLSAPRARPSLTMNRDENRAENQSLRSSIVITLIIWLLSFGFSIPYYFAYNLDTRSCISLHMHDHSGDLCNLNCPKNGSIYCDTWYPYVSNGSENVNKCFNKSMGTTIPLNEIQIEGCGSDPENDKMVTIYSTKINICHQKTLSTSSIYHVATGLMFTLLSVTLFLCYVYIGRTRRIQKEFEESLPPTRLENIFLIQKIQQVLIVQRRGLRFIMWLIAIFIFCRVPIWILIIITEQDVYSRSSKMLGIFFSLHLLANIKGALTPFLYSSSSHMLQSNCGQNCNKKPKNIYCSCSSSFSTTFCNLPYQRHSIHFVHDEIH